MKISNVLLAMSILLLGAAACNLNVDSQLPIEPTAEARLSSIDGMIWLEDCESAQTGDSPIPLGCKFWESSNAYFGNGIKETDEIGIAGVKMSVGLGICPTDGSMTTVSGPDGSYVFSGLSPGIYCVAADLGQAIDRDSLKAGAWTYPHFQQANQTLSAVVVLTNDDLIVEANFAWDGGSGISEPLPEPTATVQPEAACTNVASFLSDLTVPDGTAFGLGTGFVKTWRLRNSGTCAWDSDYSLMFVNGHRLNGPALVSIPGLVSPGQALDVSVEFETPKKEGAYQSFWMLRDPTGMLFGIGDEADRPIWIKLYAGLLPEIEGWKGEYFTNKELSGEPYGIRDDEAIGFDWKFGSPMIGIPIDNFSVRWSQSIRFDSAIYRFVVKADDGVRLSVDDRAVIDQWGDGAAREFTIDLLMKKGSHDIELEFYEHSGAAKVRLDWKKIDDDDYLGWTAKYWFNPNFKSDWALVRDEEKIEFDWGQGSPATGMPKDDFSVRWQRTLQFAQGRYQFSARADDGIRVYIDGEKILDEWHDSDGGRAYTAQVDMDGSHLVEVEYYEHKKHALINVWWEQITIPNQAPEGQGDAFTTSEDTILAVAAPGILANDSDPDGDQLSTVLVDAPTYGQVQLQSDGSFTFTPDIDFNGFETFSYRVSDGELEAGPIVVQIQVLSVNDIPLAVPDTVSTNEDVAVMIDAIANDLGLGDDPISIEIISGPSKGAVVVNSDLSLQYAPDAHVNGLDAFTYEVTDGDGESSSVVVEVMINSVDDIPQAFADSYLVQQGQTLNVAAPGILGNDVDYDGEALQAVLEDDVLIGSLTLNADGSFTYIPESGFVGTVIFSYRANDGTSVSARTIVNIDISA
jgi:hypothetical protein